MIKNKNSEKMKAVHQPVPDSQQTTSSNPRPKRPVRQGVSQYVLETAKRLKKEYQADMDYLEKH